MCAIAAYLFLAVPIRRRRPRRLDALERLSERESGFVFLYVIKIRFVLAGAREIWNLVRFRHNAESERRGFPSNNCFALLNYSAVE